MATTTTEGVPPAVSSGFSGSGHVALAPTRSATAARWTALGALNAADEAAVQLFLDGRIRFTEIAGVIGRVLDGHRDGPVDSLEAVLEADREARAGASAALAASP